MIPFLHFYHSMFYACVIFFLGTPERSHSILLQFSVSGGIAWHLMDEFYFPQTTNILFINVPLPNTAQTNATRFRLWQPYNNGKNACSPIMKTDCGTLTRLLLKCGRSICQPSSSAVHGTFLHASLLRSINEYLAFSVFILILDQLLASCLTRKFSWCKYS